MNISVFYKCRVILIALGLIGTWLSAAVSGQTTTTSIPVIDYDLEHWRKWTAEDGLVYTGAAYLDIGPTGNIIFTSGLPLSKISYYDGYEGHSIPNPGCQDNVFETEPGLLWAFLRPDNFSYNFWSCIGFQRYHLKDGGSGEWERFPVFKEKQPFTSRELLPYKKGGVMFLTKKALSGFDPETGKVEILKSVSETGFTTFSERMIQSRDGGVWIGSPNGLAKYTSGWPNAPEKDLWEEFPFDEDNEFSDFIPSSESDDGRVMGHAANKEKGVGWVMMEWDGEHWREWVSSMRRNPIGNLGGLRTDDRTLWAQSFGKGLFRIRDGVETRIKLSGLKWAELTYEQGEVFWVSLALPGLYRHADSLWKSPVDLPEGPTQYLTIIEDSKKRVWFGCRAWLVCLDGEEWKYYKWPEGFYNWITEKRSLVELENGSILAIARQRQFVLVFDPETEIFKRIDLPKNHTSTMGGIRRKNGEAWLGLYENKGSDDQRKWTLQQFKDDQFTTRSVRFIGNRFDCHNHDIAETNDSTLFIVTGAHIFQEREGIMELLTPPEALDFELPVSLLARPDGEMWIGGQDRIIGYDGSRWRLVNSDLHEIISMYEGLDGTVWIVSPNRVHRSVGDSWITYTEQEGLPDLHYGTVCVDSKARVWVGSNEGLFYYNPDADPDEPQTYIPVEKNTKTFAPGSDFQITVTGIDKWKHTLKERLMYSHRFDGDAGEWSKFTRDTLITKSGLEAGDHSIEVRAMDANANVDSTPARYTFTVLMPWYQQPAFLWASAFGILATLSAIAFATSRHFRLKHAYSESLEARKAADRANRAKSEFLANMSHEIRTPMNAVLGMIEVVLQTQLETTQRSHLETVKTAGRSLLDVISDILDISKIESGKVYFEHINFDLHEMICQVIRNLTPLAKKKQLELSLSLTSDVPQYLKGDPSCLRRILFNLIANAIKFTEEGSCSVHVSCAKPDQSASDNNGAPVETNPETSRILFEVRDTGIGIPADKLETIFETFTQADTSTTRQYGGTGLGLTIARKLAESMKGKMWVESESGQGSHFFFTAQFDRGTAASEQSPKIETIEKNTSNASNVSRKDCVSWNILVAEDNPANQTVATLFLVRMGHRISLANNGKEALEALTREQFDAILMDVQMPQVDGIEATRLIRTDTSGDFNPNIPIIAVTAHALKGDREHLMESGMTEYISKPIDSGELKSVLNRVLTDQTVKPESRPDDEPPENDTTQTSDSLDIVNNDPFLMPVLRAFAPQSLNRFETLKASIEEKNETATRTDLHDLLGSSATIGAKRLVKALETLQAKVKEQAWPKTDQLVLQVKKELDVVQVSIKTLIQSDDSRRE